MLNYKEYVSKSRTSDGKQPTVFFLHGLLGSADNWGSTCRELSEAGLRCIAVDQRNHGSSPHSSEMSYPLMADDLITVADSLGLDTFSIVGHSMGGKTAMEAALRHPNRIASIVVADIAPVQYKPAYVDYINALKKVELEGVTRRSDAGAQLEQLVPDRSLRMFFLTNLRKNEKGEFRWRINIDGITSNYANIWSAIGGGRSFSGPVLFMKGENSDFILDKHLDMMRELFPAFRLQVIENSGHWVHTEQPAIFRTGLRDFFTSSF
ncbi:MAG: alpha/beta fold hydrolase [Spirochaetales bacterium]|uniref:Alpha/beta fold hydrolase n=1 Tax=Candidatus Thalassospirochaeta sargassi TaxID=3119039 RepID=A0AAJ1MIQ5_9SPIO|nr:alpha/beta fold hydrolase [Spirochaetales bacterium]